jgi:hypothetical protein
MNVNVTSRPYEMLECSLCRNMVMIPEEDIKRDDDNPTKKIGFCVVCDTLKDLYKLPKRVDYCVSCKGDLSKLIPPHESRRITAQHIDYYLRHVKHPHCSFPIFLNRV